MNHSSAPWKVHYATKRDIWVVNDTRTVGTVSLQYDHNEADLREAHANALLIASSPTLLRVLQHLLDGNALASLPGNQAQPVTAQIRQAVALAVRGAQ